LSVVKPATSVEIIAQTVMRVKSVMMQTTMPQMDVITANSLSVVMVLSSPVNSAMMETTMTGMVAVHYADIAHVPVCL
jgi:hypothetical protein